MAQGKIRGITVEIGGDTTKLGKALEGVNKTTRNLQSELRGVESLLKMDPGNTDLLAQRQEILTEAIAETNEKLNLLKQVQAQVADQFARGEIGADQFRDFQREIIVTENRLESLQRELDGAEDEIEDVGVAAGNSSDGFTIMGGALADLISDVIQGAVSAIGDLLGSLFELSEATEEYRTMQAKLEGSAQSFGYSVDFVNEKYKQFYGYIGDDQAATNAITNLMGLGTTTESVSKLAEGAIGVWASYGDSIPIESLTESINETIQVGKVTGTMADTINWAKDANENLNKALSGNKDAQNAFNEAIKEGLPVEDAFNEALVKITDEQERADVVAQFLNTTYGESKTVYDELNGSVTAANEAELALKDTQAQLGETVAPVNNALTNLKNQALMAIVPLVEALAKAFMDLYNWLSANPGVMTLVTGVAIALATAFSVLAGALAIQALISGVTKAFAFLNTTLLANPITLIIAAIAALVAAFIYLWNNCEAFRNFWINLWEGIKTAFAVVVEWLKIAAASIADFFVAAWDGIKNAWSAVSGFFSNTWSSITRVFSNVTSWFSNTFRNAWTAIKNVFSGWGSFFSGLWTQIKDKFSDIGTSIGSAISSTIKTGLNGVLSTVESTINRGIRLINSAIRLANKIPGVNVGTLGEIKLPRLARGGIVDSPTIAEIGENGREAVIPLENNTGWIREIARQLYDYMGVNPSDEALITRLDRIYDRLLHLQVVLDSGETVGALLEKIDSGLDDRYDKLARGW